jgi:peptidoglycan biosynthesis protein MviN/MurJ (putative lipid II flippase)
MQYEFKLCCLICFISPVATSDNFIRVYCHLSVERTTYDFVSLGRTNGQLLRVLFNLHSIVLVPHWVTYLGLSWLIVVAKFCYFALYWCFVLLQSLCFLYTHLLNLLNTINIFFYVSVAPYWWSLYFMITHIFLPADFFGKYGRCGFVKRRKWRRWFMVSTSTPTQVGMTAWKYKVGRIRVMQFNDMKI